MNYLPIAIILAVVGIGFGLFMIYKSDAIIKIHIKSAAKSNWRVEPISMEKELKNTKIRGINFVALCILAIIYIKFFID